MWLFSRLLAQSDLTLAQQQASLPFRTMSSTPKRRGRWRPEIL